MIDQHEQGSFLYRDPQPQRRYLRLWLWWVAVLCAIGIALVVWSVGYVGFMGTLLTILVVLAVIAIVLVVLRRL